MANKEENEKQTVENISSMNTITNEDQIKSNDDILGREKPFKTIFMMSLGPFFAEIVAAAYGIIDSFWISQACDEDGLAALSLCSLLDTIGRAFGMFVSSAVSSQLSKLRGRKEYDSISQVFADIFRFCFILGIISPAILIPCTKPLMHWFSATDKIVDLAFSYIVPILSGSIITCLNLMFCGMLQSEGRSFAYCAVQIGTFILNGGVFDPLFMKAFKLGMFGAGLSTVCSEFCTMLVVAVLFFFKKFDTKITFSNLIHKFSPETKDALSVGFTQFVSHICFNIPSFFSRKYVSIDASKSEYSLVLTAYNVVLRTWSIPGSYCLAMSVGFLPTASYAIGAKRYKRYLKLVFWALILTFAWCAVIEVILLTLGSYIAIPFGNNTKEFRDLAEKMLRISYMFAVLMGIPEVTGGILLSTKKTVPALIVAILTQFLPVPMFAMILFYTDKTYDVVRLMYMYALHDVFSAVVSLLFMIPVLYQINKLGKERKNSLVNDQPLLASQ
ncbi:MatE family protein [Histomonas meleagridis]|uniref:MatE family protein n=1 Tax=Histomonas meleagridis TaxID=135588 RepID=UPI003559EA12|nr:MatE family protein [Histomonas meleagridis]KAH0798324.1 MatE family protein [Histomonas meleagridis]